MSRRTANRSLIIIIALLALGIAASMLQAERDDPTAQVLEKSRFEAEASRGQAPPTGGPDAYGYTYANSSTASCSYNFIDISGTGNAVALGEDVSSGPLDLNEPFHFYGTDYDQLFMSSNGFLSTTDDFGMDSTSDCRLPSEPSDGDGARLYALHDDLVLNQGFHQYFSDCPRTGDTTPNGGACTIFQWDDTMHFGGSGNFDLQAILYHGTCEVVFQMTAGNPEAGINSTTGIQNEAATSGLDSGCNLSDSFAEESAVCFFAPAISTQCGGLFRDDFETGDTTPWFLTVNP